MKKIFILMASAALMLAASCNKMEEVNTPVDTTTPVETETITVQLNPATKTSLNTDGKNTNWTSGDKVSVTVDGKNIGTLTLVEGNIFSGEAEAGHDGKAILNYPVDNDNKAVTTVPGTQVAKENSFAAGAAILEGETTMDALRAGEGAQLSNKTALLQFSVTEGGDTTFEGGSIKYTVTGCQKGKTSYACVASVSNVASVARFGGYLLKQASKNVTFTATKISNLGTLPAREKFGWGIVGQHQGWDITKPTEMYKVYDGAGDNNVNDVYAVLDVKLSADGFKFAKTGLSNWDSSNTYFGAWTKSTGKEYYNFTKDCGLGNWYGMWTDSCKGQPENIGVDDWNQKYDVYIKMTQYYPNSQNMNYTIVKAGTSMTF